MSGFHSDDYEEYYLLGLYDQHSGGIYCLHLQACCLAYSSTPNMEAVRSSKSSVNFYQTAPRNIPEDSTVLEIVYFSSID
jgi:hypothetical protein